MSRLPVLYSFRRCPYAIRVRYILKLLMIQVELREVILANKPEALLTLGGRSTVPQLIDKNGTRYAESIDIIYWALAQHRENSSFFNLKIESLFPAAHQRFIKMWFFQNDYRFKPWLDKYKYADRYPARPSSYYRLQAERFLRRLENSLCKTPYLLGNELTVADVIVFPFVRQFRTVDIGWFDNSRYQHTRKWLITIITTETFQVIMKKYPAWQPQQKMPILL